MAILGTPILNKSHMGQATNQGLGLYTDDGKENGNYYVCYIGLYRGNIGVVQGLGRDIHASLR